MLDLKGLLTKILVYIKNLNTNKINISSIVNNLTTTDAGYVLDARQGKSLNDNKLNKSNVANNLTTTSEGYALDARQGKALNDKIPPSNTSEGYSSGKISITKGTTKTILTKTTPNVGSAYLVVGRAWLNGSGTGWMNVVMNGTVVRTTEVNGGGGCVVAQFAQNTAINLQVYTSQYTGTAEGHLLFVRLR